MNKNVKGAIVVGVVLALGYIAYKKLNKPNNANKKRNGGNEGGGNEGGGNEGGGNEGGVDTDFYAMADELFDAFDGYGTKNSVVMGVMERLTKQSDWVSLQNAYGSRKVSSGTGNIFVSDFTGNLKSTLNNELSTNELKKVTSILSSNGIRF